MPRVERSFIKVNTNVSIHYKEKPRKGFWPTHMLSKDYTQWGYYPVLGGSSACQHCFYSPPAFLLRCLAAHLVNNSKQFELHSRFWKLLRDIGLWQHPRDLQNKRKFTTKDDPRETFPTRIIPSSNYYMEIHDGTFLLTAASEKILPKPKGDPVHELQY